MRRLICDALRAAVEVGFEQNELRGQIAGKQAWKRRERAESPVCVWSPPPRPDAPERRSTQRVGCPGSSRPNHALGR
jgi:hypothetical protein